MAFQNNKFIFLEKLKVLLCFMLVFTISFNANNVLSSEDKPIFLLSNAVKEIFQNNPKHVYTYESHDLFLFYLMQYYYDFGAYPSFNSLEGNSLNPLGFSTEKLGYLITNVFKDKYFDIKDIAIRGAPVFNELRHIFAQFSILVKFGIHSKLRSDIKAAVDYLYEDASLEFSELNLNQKIHRLQNKLKLITKQISEVSSSLEENKKSVDAISSDEESSKVMTDIIDLRSNLDNLKKIKKNLIFIHLLNLSEYHLIQLQDKDQFDVAFSVYMNGYSLFHRAYSAGTNNHFLISEKPAIWSAYSVLSRINPKIINDLNAHALSNITWAISQFNSSYDQMDDLLKKWIRQLLGVLDRLLSGDFSNNKIHFQTLIVIGKALVDLDISHYMIQKELTEFYKSESLEYFEGKDSFIKKLVLIVLQNTNIINSYDLANFMEFLGKSINNKKILDEILNIQGLESQINNEIIELWNVFTDIDFSRVLSGLLNFNANYFKNLIRNPYLDINEFYSSDFLSYDTEINEGENFPTILRNIFLLNYIFYVLNINIFEVGANAVRIQNLEQIWSDKVITLNSKFEVTIRGSDDSFFVYKNHVLVKLGINVPFYFQYLSSDGSIKEAVVITYKHSINELSGAEQRVKELLIAYNSHSNTSIPIDVYYLNEVSKLSNDQLTAKLAEFIQDFVNKNGDLNTAKQNPSENILPNTSSVQSSSGLNLCKKSLSN